MGVGWRERDDMRCNFRLRPPPGPEWSPVRRETLHVKSSSFAGPGAGSAARRRGGMEDRENAPPARQGGAAGPACACPKCPAADGLEGLRLGAPTRRPDPFDPRRRETCVEAGWGGRPEGGRWSWKFWEMANGGRMEGSSRGLTGPWPPRAGARRVCNRVAAPPRPGRGRGASAGWLTAQFPPPPPGRHRQVPLLGRLLHGRGVPQRPALQGPQQASGVSLPVQRPPVRPRGWEPPPPPDG